MSFVDVSSAMWRFWPEGIVHVNSLSSQDSNVYCPLSSFPTWVCHPRAGYRDWGDLFHMISQSNKEIKDKRMSAMMLLLTCNPSDWFHRTTERSVEIAKRRQVATEFGGRRQRQENLAAAAISANLLTTDSHDWMIIDCAMRSPI